MAKRRTKAQVIARLRQTKGIGPVTAEKIYQKCGKTSCIDQVPDDDASDIAESAEVSVELVRMLQADLEPKAFGTTRKLELLKEPGEIREQFVKHWQSLARQKEYCEEVLDRHRTRLLKRPDVSGVHIGLWRIGDEVVFPLQYCIRVHVVKKLDIIDDEHLLLDANSLMPTPVERTIDGIRVDILEGAYEQITSLPDHVKQPKDPLNGGVAISPEMRPSEYGTLGIPVMKNGQIRYLTNSHVVGAAGARVQHPPTESSTSGLTIGKVVRHPVLDERVDAALIRPTTTNFSETIGDVGTYFYADLHDLERFNFDLHKVGATTGETNCGPFTSLNFSVKVNVPGQQQQLMHHQILVMSSGSTDISLPGDSGSALFIKTGTPGHNRVVGLVHAKTNTGNGLVACHISEVRNKLGFEF